MERERRWFRQVSQAQRIRQGPPRYETVQNPQDLRQSSRSVPFSFLYVKYSALVLIFCLESDLKFFCSVTDNDGAGTCREREIVCLARD